MEYIVVTYQANLISDVVRGIESLVRTRISMGYQPLGGVTINPKPSNVGGYFATQAMIRER